MPTHRVARGLEADAWKRINRSGETVEYILVDGDEYVFFTFVACVAATTYGDKEPVYLTRGGLRVKDRA